MSFNKRIYNWKKILDFSKNNDFEKFDNWVFNPDAHILQDTESSNFFRAYCPLDVENREYIFSALSTENPDFTKDLIKIINVISNDSNNNNHIESINKYKSLFEKKWAETHKKYKFLTQI